MLDGDGESQVINRDSRIYPLVLRPDKLRVFSNFGVRASVRKLQGSPTVIV